MLMSSTPCEWGTAVTHKITGLKVLPGRSSTPTLSHLFFRQITAIYFCRYITLGWLLEADNWRGFESEIYNFFFIVEPKSYIIREL